MDCPISTTINWSWRHYHASADCYFLGDHTVRRSRSFRRVASSTTSPSKKVSPTQLAPEASPVHAHKFARPECRHPQRHCPIQEWRGRRRAARGAVRENPTFAATEMTARMAASLSPVRQATAPCHLGPDRHRLPSIRTNRAMLNQAVTTGVSPSPHRAHPPAQRVRSPSIADAARHQPSEWRLGQGPGSYGEKAQLCCAVIIPLADLGRERPGGFWRPGTDIDGSLGRLARLRNFSAVAEDLTGAGISESPRYAGAALKLWCDWRGFRGPRQSDDRRLIAQGGHQRVDDLIACALSTAISPSTSRGMGVATSPHQASVAASAAFCLLSPTPLSAIQPSQMAFQAQVLERPIFGQMETNRRACSNPTG